MNTLKFLLAIMLIAGSLNSQTWISSTNPTNNQLNVAKNSSIVVNFSKNIFPTSLNLNNVKITGNINGFYNCNLSYNQTQKKLTIFSNKNFLTGEIINVQLTKNIKDTSNVLMNKSYSFSFTVSAPKGSGEFIQMNNAIPTGLKPYYITTADFNNDGKPDIAVTNYNSNSISVIKNIGGLNFTSSVFNGVSEPAGIVSGDIDNDGDVDIIATSEFYNSFFVFINNGNGVFEYPYMISAGTHPTAIAIGFIDNDEFLDIAVANWDIDYPYLRIYKNNGNGIFTQLNYYVVGSRPLCIFIGDIDNDGSNDIGVGIDYSNPRVEFLKNNGLGIFSNSISVNTLDRPYGISGSDFNNDGFIDLIVTNKYSNSLSYLKNFNGTAFVNYLIPTIGNYPYGIYLNDFNKDGKTDIATAFLNTSSIDINLNTSSSPPFNTISYSNFFGVSTNLAGADYDSDGDIDLAVINHNSNSVSIYKNTDSNTINIKKLDEIIPKDFVLHQNYPNPFNPSTKINISIPKNTNLKLSVFDITGKEVKTLLNQQVTPGNYQVTWDAGNAAGGVYFFRLTTNEYSDTKKMLLIR